MITGMMYSGSGRERSGSHMNDAPRSSIVFWNTKKSANRTGIGSSMGQQPPSGLTLYSLYSLNISCCIFCGSFL